MQNEFALRNAEALLHSNGGRTVLLRLPQPPVAGDEAEVLGIATPTFQDVELGPAVFRKAGSTKTLLVSASAVARIAGTLAFDSAELLFKSAAGLVIDGVLYRVSAVVAEQASAVPYGYLLTLEN
jgi:hypothetical protein